MYLIIYVLITILKLLLLKNYFKELLFNGI